MASGSTLALREPVALAVHFEDVEWWVKHAARSSLILLGSLGLAFIALGGSGTGSK
jgi:hypothetical protein